MKGLFSHAAVGAGAGLLAGAAVGVVEVLLLALFKGSLTDLEALLYAALAYGALGLLGGAGLGFLLGLWLAWRRPGWSRPGLWAAVAALILAPLLFVVARYRVERDALGENPALTGGVTGLLILLGLLVVVAGLSLLLWIVLRRALRGRRLGWVARPLGSLGLYALIVAAAALVSHTPALASLGKGAPGPAGIPPDLRDRPNVIFIMADTLRADRLSCYGYPANQTPSIDRLAQDGVRYQATSAQASWTKPSVATMLTSLYPTSHRAIQKNDMLPAGVVSLPEVLQERGYRTAGFANNVNVSAVFGFDQGYDEYTYLAPSYRFFASEAASQLGLYQGLRRVGERFLWPGKYPQDFYQSAEVVNAHVLPWLAANKGARFFLFIHYMDPHDPYFEHPFNGRAISRAADQDPDPALAPTASRLYDGEVSYLDTHLGALFAALKQHGLYDSALIILTGDHGEEFQEHGGWWHGTTLYEEQLAVPLIIKYPANAHAGAVDTAFARSLDIAPTVLNVIGSPAPEVWQGVSLRPGAAVTRPETIFAEEDHEGNVLRAFRTQERKLITANAGNPRGLPSESLFDLRADPGEQRNLAPAEPDAVRLLRAQLDRAIAAAEALAVAGQSGALDAATRERLRQLGY